MPYLIWKKKEKFNINIFILKIIIITDKKQQTIIRDCRIKHISNSYIHKKIFKKNKRIIIEIGLMIIINIQRK